MTDENDENGRLGPIQPSRAVPPPPPGLDAAGVDIWNRVFALGQVTPADALTVERLCRLEAEAVGLRSVLEREGMSLKKPIQNSRGQLVGTDFYSHPALVSLRKLGAEAGKLCDSLGLSPQGRNRLGLQVEADREPDSVDRLQARRRARIEAAGGKVFW